jgi:hypothetical protein
MAERDCAGLLLTDGAGGFLPGVPLGFLGMARQRRHRGAFPGGYALPALC